MKPLRDRPAEANDLLDGRAESAITDNGVSARNGKVEDGGAIGVDAEVAQITGNEAGGGFGGDACAVGVAEFIAYGIGGSWRQSAAERGSQALHAAAFLVDEDERFIRADGGKRVGDEAADLVVGLAIAREQDDPERAHVASGSGLPPQSAPCLQDR